MGKLPKNFPEYLIMHKTLTSKIKSLEKERDQTKEELINDIQNKIFHVKKEIQKIEEKFPENFFNNKI